MEQQLNLKINSLKVFGERHCGTNAIGYFAGKNFNLQVKHYDFLGWKHRLAPKKNEWSKFDVEVLTLKPWGFAGQALASD